MFDADYQDSHPATPPAALHPTVNQTTTSAATSTTTSTATTTGASQAMALPAPEQLNNGGATAATSQQPQPQPQHQHRPHKRRSIGDWDFEDSIGAGSMGRLNGQETVLLGCNVLSRLFPKAMLNDASLKSLKRSRIRPRMCVLSEKLLLVDCFITGTFASSTRSIL